MENPSQNPTRPTYCNPVWEGYMADPFAMRHDGLYYVYGTNPLPRAGASDNVFPLVRSANLVDWEYLGNALKPIEGTTTISEYWAPEIAYRDSTFYMYYSCDVPGADGQPLQRLRVATSKTPEGPFQDCGHLLLPDEGFSIDAHPFYDEREDKWYLYFAKNFYDERMGTALAVVELGDDMISTVGEVRTVLRASHDWQISARYFPPQNPTDDRWHTIEGAFIVVRDGLYYCLYSGSAWTTATYGVGYAVASHPLGPWRDECAESGPVVLQGCPDKRVIGPGHNSVIIAPDNETLFCVYGAWDAGQNARRLHIDPLVWTPEGRPRCLGPTSTPQPLYPATTLD